MSARHDCDFLVIGGGFYGCALALFLRSISDRVVLVEAGDRLMERASRVNQARVHSGFHYPRSVLTAVKSLVHHRRFATDFAAAIVDDFQMLYAIARQGSKVSANRFHRMFRDMGAPIAPANPQQASLFASATIEAAFAVDEFAFDFSRLRDHVERRLDELSVDVRLGQTVTMVDEREDGVRVATDAGDGIAARFVFNVTYSQINAVLGLGGLPVAALKHELAEIALIQPPPALAGIGVTVMDGAFLSTMPYPAERLYSLTHVRYTPIASWTDGSAGRDAYSVMAGIEPETRHRHMLRDGARYLPCLDDAEWRRSLFDVKTVLVKNEIDDGRPILYQRAPARSRIVSILGGKIDNIYDLFELVKLTDPIFADADDRHVHARAAVLV